jgi:nanoRNase/pAp phosphatase (c-di-AMP/oligoRNAs hydrolase)
MSVESCFGGGHVKAAGALVDGPAEKACGPVIAAVREALRG